MSHIFQRYVAISNYNFPSLLYIYLFFSNGLVYFLVLAVTVLVNIAT